MDDSLKQPSTEATLASVVIVGAAGERLTYAIPPSLIGRIQSGHRVLVPLRSRKLTGIVVATGDHLDSGGAVPRPIIQLLGARPLFDQAHLELINFLANYYMVPVGEAYRNVMPAVARVESRRMFKPGASPGPLAQAAMTALERAILKAVSKRPMTARQLQALGPRREVELTVKRLESDGFIERHDGTRGRHRDPPPIVQWTQGENGLKVRGVKQRAIARLLDQHGALALDQIEAAIPAAKAAVRLMNRRGLVQMTEPDQMASHDMVTPANPDVPRADETALEQGPELTWEQAAAVEAVSTVIHARHFQPFLLWGVTASGKTEVYLRLAAQALATGRQMLVLVPEIALADQVVRAFRRRFGALVGIAHSGQNVADRWASWRSALDGHARIMIGPRSVVFAPLHDLGLIVADEEHDGAYKQEEGIRYHARDLAVALARFSEAPVVLGSATPSAESFVNARRGRYRLLRLARRVPGRELAEVTVVDLRQRKSIPPASNIVAPAVGAASSSPDGEGSTADVPLSEELTTALRENLADGGQSVIFLNRRGYHNFLQCHLCGNVIACPNCSVSQTFH
ncbi:MAG: replication restart helicase PriA, partial [Candidatus Binataceae bacterium]